MTAVRFLVERLVRLYYPAIALEGAARVPREGAALFVLNHPNGLLDPIVLRLALGRPVRFLGKSTLFGNPAGRLAMNAFDALPVYRRTDGADTAGNDVTFDLCRAALGRGEWLALFPEGTSHSDPEMKPLKTGAARIALSTADASDGARPVAIVPVGLFYEQKSVFRSRALAVVGEPFDARAFLDAWRRDEREAGRALTDAIRGSLDAVVLQADSRALLDGIAQVAHLTLDEPSHREDLAARHARAQRLRDAYVSLRARDPARLDALVQRAQEYLDAVRALGVDDPWALELRQVRWLPALRVLATLLALAPFAAVGALLGWVPYRLAGRVAGRIAQEDVLGTYKLLGGAMFVLVAWLLEASLAAWRLSPLAGLAVLLIAPACGYAALRFEETWALVRETARIVWMRRDVSLTQAIVARRRALADAIAEALGEG